MIQVGGTCVGGWSVWTTHNTFLLLSGDGGSGSGACSGLSSLVSYLVGSKLGVDESNKRLEVVSSLVLFGVLGSSGEVLQRRETLDLEGIGNLLRLSVHFGKVDGIAEESIG